MATNAIVPDAANKDQILLLILAGTYDPESPFFKLGGMPHIVKRIYTLATCERK